MHKRSRIHAFATLALLCVGASAISTVAHAFAPTILVVRGPSVSSANFNVVASALGSVGELIDPSPYLEECAARRLPPTSDRALSEIAPSLHVRLIVSLTNVRGRLLVSLYDGRDAAALDALMLTRNRGRLARDASEQTQSAAMRALGQLQPQTPAADGGSARRSAPALPNYAPPVQANEAVPAPAPDPVEVGPTQLGRSNPNPDANRLEVEPPPPPSAAEPGFRAAVSFGPGFGQRSVSVPSLQGTRNLSTKLFPALDLRVDSDAVLAPGFALDARIEYQTSLGLHAYQALPGRSDQRETSLRSHHLVFGIAPRFRFAESEDGVSLAVLLGWGFRGLRPVSATEWPPYTLHGPVIRPELRIAIGASVALRLAPEIFVVTGVTSELRDLAAAGGVGIGIGGELAIDVALAQRAGLTIAYRESDVSLGTGWGPKLHDRERFASAAAVLKY